MRAKERDGADVRSLLPEGFLVDKASAQALKPINSSYLQSLRGGKVSIGEIARIKRRRRKVPGSMTLLKVEGGSK